MKNISYSIICEDVAHSAFIAEFLNYFAQNSSGLVFSLNEACFNTWVFKNKAHVLNFYVEVSDRWFNNNKLDLLFIIVDFDDWEIAEFESWHKELSTALRVSVRNKSLILLPVRAIEFWMYHLKWRVENPNRTTNIPNENMDRKEVKKYVYGTKKPYRELTEKTVLSLMANFNASWLISRSKSFNHFYTNFQKFVER